MLYDLEIFSKDHMPASFFNCACGFALFIEVFLFFFKFVCSIEVLQFCSPLNF